MYMIAREKIIDPILNFIEDNIEEGISVENVVAFSGYSRRHLQTLFSEATGISLGSYIRSRKLCLAANWLRLTSMPVTQIAYALGFGSQQSFGREFKRLFGLSPRSFRMSETWDMSSLRPPLIQVREALSSLGDYTVCHLPEQNFVGYEVSHNEPIPYKASGRGTFRLKTIESNLSLHKQDIYLLSHSEVIPDNNHQFCVKTFIGIPYDKKKNSDMHRKMIFEAGLYIKYQFSGDEEEYEFLPTKLSLELLPTLNLKRRRGVDMEHIYLSETILDNSRRRKITCDYYIPVAR